MPDVPRRRRLPLHYSSDGRNIRVFGVRLDFSEGSIEVESAVLDTGMDVAIFGPEEEVARHLSETPFYRGTVKGIAGNQLQARIRDTTIVLGSMQIPGKLYTAKKEREWVIGLPVLRRFHLLLPEDDADVSSGACLVAPPLLTHYR